MSLGIYPVFKPRVPEAAFDGLGESLAAEFEALDKFADEHGLVRLASFTDTRQVPEDFDGPPEELEKVMGPWEDCFSCSDGQLAFEALARLVTTNTAVSRALETPEAVAAELLSIAQALAVGEAHHARFRLEMS